MKTSAEHKELIKQTQSFIEFADSKSFHYMIVAGKDGTHEGFARGEMGELQMMLLSLMQDHAPFADMILDLPKLFKSKPKLKKVQQQIEQKDEQTELFKEENK